jgi:hypothetical protein
MLTNFVLSYIFTLHLHEYSNDRLKLISRAIPSVEKDIFNKLLATGKIDEDTKDEVAMALGEIMSNVHTLISDL